MNLCSAIARSRSFYIMANTSYGTHLTMNQSDKAVCQPKLWAFRILFHASPGTAYTTNTHDSTFFFMKMYPNLKHLPHIQIITSLKNLFHNYNTSITCKCSLPIAAPSVKYLGWTNKCSQILTTSLRNHSYHFQISPMGSILKPTTNILVHSKPSITQQQFWSITLCKIHQKGNLYY